MATILRTDDTGTLIPAKFDNYPIDVMNTRDADQRSAAAHTYPFVDGADIEDLGADGRRISMTLVFFGPYYQVRLKAFLERAARHGSKELIHPVFGSIRVQYVSGEISHDAEQPEYCELRAEFLEHAVGTPSFANFTPNYAVASVDQVVETAQVAARAGLVKSVAVSKPKTLKGYLGAMSSAINRLKVMARGLKSDLVYSLGLSNLFDAASFAGDMQRLFKGAVGELMGPLKTLGSVGAVNNWRAPAGIVRAPLLDAPLDTVDAVPAPMRVHVQQQQALALALLARGVFEIELQTPTLTPQDIEAVANDVRSDLQAAIVATQAAYPLLADSRPMTESLKAVAAGLQAAALALIQAKPPLIQRRVPTNMNLHLLAHHWYADAERAAEILRLNPSIRHPNFIAQGALLYGYAE